MGQATVTICSGCGLELPCRYNRRGDSYCSDHCEKLIKQSSRRERTTNLVEMFDPDGPFQAAIRRSLTGY
jgi:predicted nucleic acid-binding Zn ribbon protein